MDIFTDKYIDAGDAWDYDNDEGDGVVAATTVDNDD